MTPTIPETKLKYFEDTYLFEYQATLMSIIKDDNFPDKQILILDETIFYPQGGGQPSDTGTICSQDNKIIFQVEKVLFNPEGQVWHIGNFVSSKDLGFANSSSDSSSNINLDNRSNAEPNIALGHESDTNQDKTKEKSENFLKVGGFVKLKIDSDRRILNSKNHTAGHLIDWAVESLSLPLKANKGYHFPEGACVEYSGDLGEVIDADKQIQDKANQIILQNPKISFVFENQKHSSGKPNRIMSVEGYKQCPCGGTHVRSTLEIGSVIIRKIKSKSGAVKISYQIQDSL